MRMRRLRLSQGQRTTQPAPIRWRKATATAHLPPKEDETAAATPGAKDDAAGTDTMAEGDGVASATDEEGEAAAAEPGAGDDATGWPTT